MLLILFIISFLFFSFFFIFLPLIFLSSFPFSFAYRCACKCNFFQLLFLIYFLLFLFCDGGLSKDCFISYSLEGYKWSFLIHSKGTSCPSRRREVIRNWIVERPLYNSVPDTSLLFDMVLCIGCAFWVLFVYSIIHHILEEILWLNLDHVDLCNNDNHIWSQNIETYAWALFTEHIAS